MGHTLCVLGYMYVETSSFVHSVIDDLIIQVVCNITVPSALAGTEP